MSQTAIQNANAIRTGSVKVEVGASLGSMVNIGALRGASWVGKGKTEDILFDNASKITKVSDGDVFSIKAQLCEIDWTNIQALNDGQVAISNVAGTPVVGAIQTIAAADWSKDVAIEFEGQQSNGTVPTAISVKADGVTVLAAKYTTVKVADKWALVITDAGVSGVIEITYTYTPTASKVVTFNASAKKVGKYIRITNTNESGKTMVLVMSGVTNIAPIEISFASDSEANVSQMPIELEGKIVSVTDSQA